MSTELDDLIRRAEKLSHQNRLRLVEHQGRKVSPETAGRQWREICGAAPYPLLGEDAQTGCRAPVERGMSIDKTNREIISEDRLCAAEYRPPIPGHGSGHLLRRKESAVFHHS
jgi:hypothetical protein